MLWAVAEFTDSVDMRQRVCDHPAQTLASQNQITDLHAQRFLPLQWGPTEMENTIQELETELAEARTRPPAEATNKQLREDLLAMTQDTQQSREEVRGLRTQ